MKKPLFHFVRYIIIIFPIVFLIVVLAHTHYYTDRNRIFAAHSSTRQYLQTQALSFNQSHNIAISRQDLQATTKQITNHYEWKNIIHQIYKGNKEWANLIPNILPCAPTELHKQLNHAIAHALLIKPGIILQSLALTDSTLNNTDMICKAPGLNKNQKLHLATILQSIHNPSFIYQQQSCLHTLLGAIKHKQSKIS